MSLCVFCFFYVGRKYKVNGEIKLEVGIILF